MPRKSREEPHEDALSTLSGLESSTSLDDLVSGINAAARKDGAKRDVIVLARNASNPFELRRPFGIASLDIATGGGPPAGGLTIVSGPSGTGKNGLIWTCIATCQHIYGKNTRVGWAWFEFPIDKGHGRIIGAVCPSSEIELAMERQKRYAVGLPDLSAEMLMDRRQQIGEFVVVEGDQAETGKGDDKKSRLAESKLDAIVDLTALNACQIIVMDSLGSIVPADIADSSLTEETRRAAGAALQTRFQQRIWNALAAPVPGRGSLNLTTLLAIGQVRSKQGAQKGPYAREWEAKGAHAIRHGKLVEVQLTEGERIKKGVHRIGKKVKYEVTKGKAGCHEGGSGELNYHFDSGYDRATDLIGALNVQHQLSANGRKVDVVGIDGIVVAEGLPHGEGFSELRQAIVDDPELFWTLHRSALQAAGVSCLNHLQ